MMQRRKNPNHGLWSCIGGKLEMDRGESPYECAIREVNEETGFQLQTEDLHLFGLISEKNYEGTTHWLMFMFECKKILPWLPESIEEGDFAFHSLQQISKIPIPETDRAAIWPAWRKHKNGFIALTANCDPGAKLSVSVEEIHGMNIDS